MKAKIVVRIWGGLGNQLFQYAFALALSELGDYEVFIDNKSWFIECQKRDFSGTKRTYLLGKFNISLKEVDPFYTLWKKWFSIYNENNKFTEIICRILNKYFRNGLLNNHIYHYEDILGYDDKILGGGYFGNCYVHGYFQCPHYFESIRTQILNEFKLKKEVDFSKYELEKNTIALHIRRGDYVKYGDALAAKYFENAVNYMLCVVEKPIFYIFSDDLAWAKTININGDYILINEEQNLADYEELMLMSKCKHFIISNSSFSWWGAWLSTYKMKKVVCPRQWADFEGRNIALKHWVRM